MHKYSQQVNTNPIETLAIYRNRELTQTLSTLELTWAGSSNLEGRIFSELEQFWL